ncbi:LPXTG cell wall anchor domain-containing protein [Streptococcus suis]|uniref:LPXTG cell wall anchor domain-containing protein n=1 Tax=Streptococcus suis TaxID=1307 RepID=UPI00194F4D46|nr:LPXTG cell wall anchor domain-containing protein [Streptococcus suis]MBM6380580.1 LPXTG cell wall anchor domain-containing protein [Streptococcus suis]MCP8653888.1 LPXTG cell wall anchor domain-containing protein [Streptococcus suis]
MSKQKVVSSLLLSTVVLGGLAFYSTTTVKAESLEPDVTSVSSSDATNKLVVSNEEESDFLAEEELEESDAPVETLNEEIKDVTEPGALLQPRAMMSNSGSNHTEEIPVDDSVSEKVVEKPLIQSSNADSPDAKGREKLQKSVTIDSVKLEEKQITWRVNFDTSEWSFNHRRGGLYFILPKGLKLTSIKDDAKIELFERFPKTVENSKNNSNDTYRFFSQEETGSGDKDFNRQWGWSAGQANPDDTVKKWKSENRFSKIYFIDNITTTTQLTYSLTASVTAPNQKSFPVAAVIKTFGYKNWSRTEVTSLGAREITLETLKETPLPPKEEAPKPELEAPKPDSGIILKPLPKPEVPQTPPAPSTPEKQPEETPKVPESPKEDTPAPPAPSVPEEPQTPQTPPAPEAPTEEPKETPKPEMPEAPQVPEEQPKDTPAPEVPLVPEEKPMGPEVDKPKPEAPQAPSTPEEKPQVPEAPKPAPEAPKEEPKQEEPQTPQVPSTPKEEAPKEEVPTPPAPSVPEEQPKETPTPEVPKQEEVQPEAPKSDEVESDKPMPETKKPDMKQPKADDMPKEQQPKAEAPKAEQPQMDKPQMEAPKKDSEAPKSDKAETDKPMPETKQPDMKQPKADKPEAEKAQMPRTEGMKPESKASMMPKAEAPKATLPNTGEASSAIGWLGGALATLATGLYLFKNKKEE